jgi:transcriptional regulator with XRE-family HTH domain
MTAMSSMTEAGIVPEWTQGDRLAKSLRERGITVQQMADFLDVSRNTVGNYIHDKRKVPKAVLRVWALRTGLPLVWLESGIVPEDGDDPDELPWFDSNEQPSGYALAQVIGLPLAPELDRVA